ncbi:agmatine deiminase family protein [Streptacidiphilus anmyonensis]|uniref:agmatine deiminase family protein n=1 Tax=Streptacidiphilus anmyonensis TaxID=405782 RepID=UPI000A055D11|nr:agmatine deiminase family protein [Streptacidiphilus anmyonensis]
MNDPRSLFGRLFGAPQQPEETIPAGPRARVEADDVPHARTWMSWPASRSVWGRQLDGVQQDIALIARTVARFEPVTLCAPDERAAVAARALCGDRVEVISSIPTDDLWMRDTCAAFRRTPRGSLDAVGLNFNGWGRKQAHDRDAAVARAVAAREGLPFEAAAFVGEAGAVETDGDGTVMATESSLVNRNRNRGMSRDEIERAVLDAYGADRMIWVRGVKGRDITDDHIDVTSRFVRPGVVMVQVPPADRHDVWARDAREQLALLESAVDARGRRLQVIRVDGPERVRSRKSTFVDSYLNFHLVNGGVVTAQFGDVVKDEEARQALAAAFPGREVVQLDVDRLMAGGGGIHCSTMQQPRA